MEDTGALVIWNGSLLFDWDRFLDAREMEAPTGLWRRGLFDYLV